MGLGVPRRRNCLETPRAVLEAASISETVSLERITDCQMAAHAVFEVRNIVIAFLSRIVRYVLADSPIQADNEEGQVVA